MTDRFDEGMTGLGGVLAQGTHAFMYTGHNLWKNLGHESPLCDSMLAQSGKHATQPASATQNQLFSPLCPSLDQSLTVNCHTKPSLPKCNVPETTILG